MGLVSGKVVLITGGARGQGRSHAVSFAREGADVIICDIASQPPDVMYPVATEADLEETKRLVEAEDRRCVAVKADVADEEQMRAVVERGLEELTKIDILLANAGIVSYGRSWEIAQEQWDVMLRVNLTGVWQSAKAVIPHLLDRDQGGAMVFTASVSGLDGFANVGHYVAAKHGVVGLMKTLAVELAPHSIRVNAVCPGNVSTKMIHNQETYDTFAERFGATEATYEALEESLARWHKLPVALMDPSDISNAMLYLCSDMGRYVTGRALAVDAGMLMH